MTWRFLRVARLEISLQESRRSLFLLATFGFVCGFLSLFLAAETSLLGIVTALDKPSVGRSLLPLDQGDPQLEYALGRAYKETHPAEGVRHLRRATELSPYSRRYWAHLGSACEAAGDTACALQAWERLLQLCPMVPLYHWSAAESYLAVNRQDESVAQFRRLLQLDPGYASSTWVALQPVLGPDAIFEKVLADRADSGPKVDYVDFLSDEDNNDAAYRAWKLTVADSRPFAFSAAAPYLDRLIDRGRIDEADAVWRDLERLKIVRMPGGDGAGNVIFNGDFEQAPLNAGFDWRWSSNLTFLALDFSAPGAFHGDHCLRIDFTVSRNSEYEPVYQIVPVVPNTTYTLQAYVRSEAITSDTGPSLRVSDTQPSGFRDAISDTTVGTTPWHPVRVYFSTGPATRSVRLSVWRPLGRTYPTEIWGTFWLDAVSIESLGARN
jgi:tetratricopeptide (TPR) repeat protein